MRIIVFGAHASDAESGAGGTIIKMARKNNEVIIVPLTHNEKVRSDRSVRENIEDTIREAKNASNILNAKLEFLNFVDGEINVDKHSTEIISSYIKEKKPDIVFTHWPIDTHPDHQATGILVLRSILSLKNINPELYFFEVWPGEQTNLFIPDRYVDISDVAEEKIKALLCYETERVNDPKKGVLEDIKRMMEFRGKEAGVKYAEAFVSLRKVKISDIF